MELRPGYKQTEVGVIPEDWEVTRLGEVFDVTSSKRVFQSDWKSAGVPFYRARELAVLAESGEVENELFITADLYESFRKGYGVPATGDMLVTGVGTLGKVYVVRGDHDFYFKDGNIIWFQMAGKMSSEFLRQLYLTPLLEKQIFGGSAGTTVGTYTITAAKKTVIPFPLPPEQSAIATALSDVDALLAAQDALIAKKRAIKQGAMQELLTGKRRLPGFSGGWDVKRLGSVLRFQVGFPFSSLHFNGVGNGIRLVKNRDLKADDQLVYYNGAYELGFVVKSGDVLIGMDGDFLPCMWAGGEALLNQRIGRIVPSKNLDLTYACYRLVEPLKEIEAITSSTTVKHLSHGDVEGIEMPLPDIDEQIAIADVLREMTDEIAAIEAQRAKTAKLKQGMLQELLTGRIRLV